MSSQSYSLRITDIIALEHLQENKYHASRFVKTKGNFIACSTCCHTFRERFALVKQWQIVTCGMNHRNGQLFCTVCEQRIVPVKPVKILSKKARIFDLT
jgi:hypothetical protein